MTTPIIEEVLRIRDEHSRRFNYNLDAISENYKKRQEKLKSRLVRRKPGDGKKRSELPAA